MWIGLGQIHLFAFFFFFFEAKSNVVNERTVHQLTLRTNNQHCCNQWSSSCLKKKERKKWFVLWHKRKGKKERGRIIKEPVSINQLIRSIMEWFLYFYPTILVTRLYWTNHIHWICNNNWQNKKKDNSEIR